MRTDRGVVAVLAIALAAGLSAQPRGGGNRGGGGGQGRPGNQASGPANTSSSGIGVSQIRLRPGWGLAPSTGFGNVANPGGVSNHPQPNFLQPNPVIQPLPQVVQPLGSMPFKSFAPQPHRSRVRTVFVPVYYGAGYGLGYGYPTYDQQAPETVYVPVDNGGPGTGNGPGVWGGSQPPAASNYIYTVAPDPKPAVDPKPVTLLVFKNHSIYAVTDYWLEDGRIHYVTSYGAQDSASTDQLDLDFTRKLNDERSVKFELKPKA
jgi:hypothetical protein